ncbi:DUF362 domain-containing protein [Methanobacterium alcaliphilum]|uniref:DUF362 domain-containing protein n=1 Tax=Methanobacterium alcaliphilum TaxID=392018 RepID=UPI00200B7C12|nr:DUF362 domain-containing protein [Methanobacterium alcaliphilum]MCK9151217.1 DUF362 domain-containing protein [Methanobacterium alcaliphilum]
MKGKDKMVGEVYFADFRSRSSFENNANKIERLFERAGFGEIFNKDDLTAVKVHFGERGNDSYVSPVMIRHIIDKIKNNGSKPFITDTNTLYFGSRHNSVDHIQTAILNGFSYSVVGVPLIIADGLQSQNEKLVKINGKHFKEVKIAGDILKSDSMMVVSHFKGHGMSGFGGALKNLAMGCATIGGKLDQHESAKPIINNDCSACGLCVPSCPVDAMHLMTGDEKNQVIINYDSCIACMNCLDTCSNSVIDLDWENEIPTFIEKMMEYAWGAIQNKSEKTAYINFLINITPDCDCVGWSDAPFVPDIGILASKDPVAIDMASYDLVNQQKGIENNLLEKNFSPGEDKFQGIWKSVDGKKQLEYAEKLGIGAKKYELISVD